MNVVWHHKKVVHGPRLEVRNFHFCVSHCQLLHEEKGKLWKLLNKCLSYIPVYYNELHYSFIWYLKLGFILSVKISLPTSNWNCTEIFVKSVISYHIIWYHIIYFHSVDPYRITKSIWIWKQSYFLKKSRRVFGIKVYNNFSY